MYRNTQFGTVIVVSLLGVLAFGIWFGLRTSWQPVAIALPAIIVAVLALFYRLTVTVDADAIRCAFGIGLISRTIPLDRVKDAQRVRNRWYYGWGIRRVPGAWMFNVSGLDAVEVTLEGGKRFRIGTDDPEGLLAAIRLARKS